MPALDKKILKDVSRSFYLSVRLLPRPMRDPVSLGYLLARASDSLADTESLPATLRLEMLRGMRSILHGGERSPWLARLKKEVIPLQPHEGESLLLEHMEQVLNCFDGFASEPQKRSILKVMEHILRGQILDIERFELAEGEFMCCLENDLQLEEYCYLVAGCVGEFWTEIGSLSLPSFSTASTEDLMLWGRNYGKGLQLINILRDLPNDLAAGRCYLPGVDPEDRDQLLAESARWRRQARHCLAAGARYAASLAARRTRIATALPGLIGERTLDALDQADWQTLTTGVKVKRSEVYRCLWDALIA